MKRIIIVALTVLIWGCAKKISPSNSGTASSPVTTPAATMPVDYNTGAGTQPPVENSGTYGTKAAPKERSAEENTLMLGQSTYNAKCGSCHGLKVTSDYTVERWASILAVMAPYAKLTETEKQNVYAYVKANAKK